MVPLPPFSAVLLAAALLVPGLQLAVPGSTAPGMLGGGNSSPLLPQAAPIVHLVVRVQLDPNRTVSGGTVVVRAWVTGNGTPLPNVTVSFASSSGGSFYPQTGATGVAGETNTSFTAPRESVLTTLSLRASASNTGSGFRPGTGSSNLTVRPTGPYLVATPSFPQGTSVHSGASNLIVVRVTDGTGKPLGGAQVTMGATVGTVSPALATSGTTGNATLTLYSPNVTVAVKDWLLFAANESGYANGSNSSSVTVNSGVAPSLFVSIAPASASLAAGASQHVSVRVANATGAVISGANVTLILSDGVAVPSSAATGGAGTANFTYTAPAFFSRTTNVTITASATATNYAAGSASAIAAVSPASHATSPNFFANLWWLWLLMVVAIVAIVVAIVMSRRRRKASVVPVPTASSRSG